MPASSKKNTKKSAKKNVVRAAKAEPMPPSKEDFLKAFQDVYTISAAAARVGLTRRMVMDWMADDPDFKARVLEMKEEHIEMVEDIMFDTIITKKSDPMIMFYLQTQGRHKGYGTKKDDKDKLPTLPKKVTVTVVTARKPKEE